MIDLRQGDCLEIMKDIPDADMYIELGEYKEFKHILDLIHKERE